MGIVRYFSEKWLQFKYGRNMEGDGKINFDIRASHFILDKSSVLNINGTLNLGWGGVNSCVRNGRSNIMRMDSGAVVSVNGKFMFMYGTDIIVFEGGRLILGDNSFINSDCKIRCHKEIKIGNDCAISHDFTIMDSDGHYLNGEKHTCETVIEDKVWIGTRVTILSGARIGTGSVIAAGSVVTGEIPPYSLAAGVPAKVVRSNVDWSR